MSSQLFKRSLEIIDRVEKRSTKESTFDLIPENLRALKTVNVKGKKRKYNEISVKKKVTLEDAQQKIKSSQRNVDKNLETLLRLSSSSKLDKDTKDKLSRRALSNHYIIPEEPKVVEEESIFTEEDFKNFEKELYVD